MKKEMEANKEELEKHTLNISNGVSKISNVRRGRGDAWSKKNGIEVLMFDVQLAFEMVLLVFDMVLFCVWYGTTNVSYGT